MPIATPSMSISPLSMPSTSAVDFGAIVENAVLENMNGK